MESVLRRLSGESLRTKDWQRTIGMFDRDSIMKEVIDGAQSLRDEERTKFYAEYERQIEGS